MIRFSKIPDILTVTEEEKKLLIENIDIVVAKAEQARREGILALEDNLEEERVKATFKPMLFYYEILSLVVDGIDGDTISTIGMNLISSTKKTPAEELGMMMMLNGALGIQEGLNPRVLQQSLLAMLGLEVFSELRKRT